MNEMLDGKKNNIFPDGWVWTITSDVCSSVRDGTHETPKYVQKGIPLITSKNLKENGLDFSTSKNIGLEDHEQISKRSGVENGDILYAMIGTIGNPVVVQTERIFSIKNVALFKKNESVIKSQYLKFWLSSLELNKLIESNNFLKGTTQKFIPLEYLRILPVPLPPFPEQNLIVTRVDILFDLARKANESLDKIPRIMKRFRQAALKKAISGELTTEWRAQQQDLEPAAELLKRIQKERKHRYEEEVREAKDEGRKLPKKPKFSETEVVNNSDQLELPEEWVWTSLSEQADTQSGFACGNKNVQDGLIHFRMNNIGENCYLNMDLIRKVPLDFKIEKYLLKKGDLLFCHTNSSKLVGKNAIFNLDGDYAYSNHLTRIRVDSSIISSKWLWCILTIYWKEGRFENECKNWVNQSTLPLNKLNQLSIPIPPLLEQQEIIRRIESLFKFADKTEKNTYEARKRMEIMTQSILTRAFRGDLSADFREAVRNWKDLDVEVRGRYVFVLPEEEREKVLHADEFPMEPASGLLERIGEDRANKELGGKVSRRKRRGQNEEIAV